MVMITTIVRALILLASVALAEEESYMVDFDVQLEDGISKAFTVEVHPAWAPLVNFLLQNFPRACAVSQLL